jgi:hypothetical protein
MQGGIHGQRKEQMLGCREMEEAGASSGGGVEGLGWAWRLGLVAGRRLGIWSRAVAAATMVPVGDLEKDGGGGWRLGPRAGRRRQLGIGDLEQGGGGLRFGRLGCSGSALILAKIWRPS